MDLSKLAEKERRSRKYAEEFFREEWEMEGIFKVDLAILDRVIRRKGCLLDVAMGPGRHVRHFAGKGFRVHGNDFNRHMIAAAKKYVGKSFVEYTNHDMRNLETIESGYFDYVICMGASLGSIYRKRERQKAVNEMARVAKKSGLVFIHAHNLLEISGYEDFSNLVDLIRNKLSHPREREIGDIIYYHGRIFRKAYMHWFTPWEMRALMGKAGLKVVEEIYLKGPDQDSILGSNIPLFSYHKAGGFVFVGKKG